MLDAHVMVRRLSALLLASRNVAVAVTVCPIVAVVALSDTATDATGTETTVRLAAADLPCADAVMVAVPGATAVIKPAEVTVAMAAFDVAHVRVTPDSAPPDAVWAIAPA